MSPDEVYADVVGKYSRHINPSLAKLMAFAGFGVETYAEGCYVYDQEGRKFLDCLGGYGTFALGHRHPKVIEAVKRQLDQMGLGAKAFFNKPSADLAEKLASIAPPGVDFVFFCNSGTEAVEAALKFAKGATGRARIVSTDNSYHGKTLGALSTTGREKYRKRFEPLLPGVAFVPYGDIAATVEAIDYETAAFIVEPVQGEGGIIIPPEGYLTAIRDRCLQRGALFICDEVQTGFGRTGRMFGCDRDRAEPDLMPLAKSLGGGVMPLGALMGTKDVFDTIFGPNPMAHTSTFGGSPIASAAGLAAIEVLQTEGLVERSRISGERLRTGLESVRTRHSDLIREVRGIGLMVGVEFQMDEVGELVVAQLLKRGICVAYALNNPRVLRFEPPLIITDGEIDFAVEGLDSAVAETGDLLAELV